MRYHNEKTKERIMTTRTKLHNMSIDEIAKHQGWSEETLQGLVIKYASCLAYSHGYEIPDYDSDDVLRDFLAEEAWSEIGRKRKAMGAEREALEAKILGYLESHPNTRVEELVKELSANRDDVRYVVARLFALGKVRRRGNTRATKYSLPA